jgi:hypothetical protein
MPFSSSPRLRTVYFLIIIIQQSELRREALSTIGEKFTPTALFKPKKLFYDSPVELGLNERES